MAWSTAVRTIAPVSALLTSVRVKGSLWKFAIPPTIAARWITWVQPAAASRPSSAMRRSPWWISQPSRIHAGASRWSDTRTSQAGSRSRRRTTAEPIVPAPPVTRTRLIGRPSSASHAPRLVGGRAGAEQRRRLAGVEEHLGGAEGVPRVDEQAVGGGSRDDLAQRVRALELGVVGGHDHHIRVADRLVERLRRGRGVGVADGD